MIVMLGAAVQEVDLPETGQIPCRPSPGRRMLGVARASRVGRRQRFRRHRAEDSPAPPETSS